MIAFADPPIVQTRVSTQRDYLSWSAITTFQKCPLKYFYRYVEEAPEEFGSVNLLFGKAVHAALEHHFQARLAGDPVPSLEEVLGAYDTEWQGVDLNWVKWGTESSVSLRDMASRMLAAFHGSPAAQPVGRVLALEEEVRAPLIAGTPDLLGRIDLALETSDALNIIDFKTSRSRWSTEQVAESSGQLLLYSQLAGDLAHKPVKLSFVVLTKTKTPDVSVHDVSFDGRLLDRTLNIIEHVWKSITAGNFYPVPSVMNCPSCPYRKRCAAWKG